MLKIFYALAKPGIVYGNLLSAVAGFLFGARWHVHVTQLLAMVIGLSLVMAAGCVFNNCMDRDIDAKMARTKNRALVKGAVSLRAALIFASILGATGFALLIFGTNWLTVIVALVGFVDYVVLYDFAKRRTVHGTLVGSVSGATPIMVGYIAATGQLNAAAIILFIIMALWQMPHFYGIAMYRLKEYAAADIPVLPRVSGVQATKKQIIVYVSAFALACVCLTIFGKAGYVFAWVMLLTSAWWLWLGLVRLKAANDETWGRQMFLFSLKALMTLSLMLVLSPLLP